MTNTPDTSPEAVERFIAQYESGQQGCHMDADEAQAFSATLRALSAERDALKAENARLEAWQYAAFMVHSNLDLDIEGHPEARAALRALEQGSP